MKDGRTHDKSVPADLKSGLRNYWYPVALSEQVAAARPLGIKRLGEKLVVWRDSDGVAHVFVDRCAHRAAPLSLGDIVDGRIQCRYHGLQYDGTGQCRLVPIELTQDGPCAMRMRVQAYHAEERAGFIWAYLSSKPVEFPPPLELDPCMADPDYVWMAHESLWHANWLLIHDNTADPVHFPFLHGHFAAQINNGKVSFVPAGPGNPAVTPEVTLDTVQQRFTAKRSEKGIFQEAVSGSPGDESERFDEIEFELPCLVKVWVPFPDGGTPMRFLQYELPIDAEESITFTWAGKKAHNETERQIAEYTTKTFGRGVIEQVFDEDQWICNAQGDVDTAQALENLLPTDKGVLAVRRCIRQAYKQQIAEACELAGASSSGTSAITEIVPPTNA
jgi:phenylpropionate dioxygenase-like ring-hydroxylating dioxygenase large terminal subunit